MFGMHRCRQQTSDYKQEFRLDARCRVPSIRAGGERQHVAEKQLGHMLGMLQAARELGLKGWGESRMPKAPCGLLRLGRRVVCSLSGRCGPCLAVL